MNNNWKLINLDQYLEFRKFMLNDKDIKFKHVNYFENVDAMNIPLNKLNNFIDKWDFVLESFEDVAPINLYNTDFLELSGNQWADIDSLLLNSKDAFDNIHLLISICSFKSNEYSFKKAESLSKEILNKSMFEVIPQINFFFWNVEKSSKNINTCLNQTINQQISQHRNLIDNLINLNKNGTGTQYFTKWLMKIYLKLIKYYYCTSKIFSPI